MHDSLIVIAPSNPSGSKKNNFALPELTGDGVHHQAAFQLSLPWVVTDNKHHHFFGPPRMNPTYCYPWLPKQPLKRRHKNNLIRSYLILPDPITEHLSHRKEIPSSGKRGSHNNVGYTTTGDSWETPASEAHRADGGGLASLSFRRRPAEFTDRDN